MKRLILILLLTTSLLALTSAVVYASPTMEPERQDGPDLDQAIGTLGLYAALMAVLAVGAEIVIDTLRPVFGLQRKATTAESLKKLNDWLPGATKELGLSADAQTRINETIKELEGVTQKFQTKADEAKGIMDGEWRNLLNELALDSVDNILKYRWSGIEMKLNAAGVNDADIKKMEKWIEQKLGEIRSSQDGDTPNQLALLNGVMQKVAEQRNEIQGPTRKLWRQIRDRLVWVGKRITGPTFRFKGKERRPLRAMRHLFFMPAYLEAGWARLWRRLTPEDGEKWKWEEVIEDLGKPQGIKDRVATNLQDAAKLLLEEDAKNHQEEANRVKWLRIISAVAGVALAYALQIDSLQLLEPILSEDFVTSTLKETVNEKEKWKTIGDLINAGSLAIPILGPALDSLLRLTPGIVLSGLGAAAGSGFWHDRLDNLRAAKGVVETAEEVKLSVSGEGEKE